MRSGVSEDDLGTDLHWSSQEDQRSMLWIVSPWSAVRSAQRGRGGRKIEGGLFREGLFGKVILNLRLGGRKHRHVRRSRPEARVAAGGSEQGMVDWGQKALESVAFVNHCWPWSREPMLLWSSQHGSPPPSACDPQGTRRPLWRLPPFGGVAVLQKMVLLTPELGCFRS